MKTLRHLGRIITICAALLPQAIQAQDAETTVGNEPLNLSLEARGDYVRRYVDGDAVKDDCGFKGQYLNLKLSGTITRGLEYGYRQRLNKISKNSSFFDATDYLYLSYTPVQPVTLSAGKQVVAIGGYEYDRAPIDLYVCSEFWNQIPCYSWGVSATYNSRGGTDHLTFQVCESPFRSRYTHADMYAYNLMWSGSHGLWSTLWSANMSEWAQGKFINYIALGNRFALGKKWALELDVMNRAAGHQVFLGQDWSVMAELQYKPSEKVRLSAKVTHDQNDTRNNADFTVTSGSKLTMVAAVAEYYPLKNYDVRVHGYCSYSWGRNTNADGYMADRHVLAAVGLTWRADLFPWRKFRR